MQWASLVIVQNSLTKPHPLLCQFPHHIKRLVTFLGLQSINAQHHVIHVVIDFGQPLRMPFTSNYDRLLSGDHIFNGIIRDANLIAVLQLPRI